MEGVAFLITMLGVTSRAQQWTKFIDCYEGYRWDHVRHPYVVSVIYTHNPPPPDISKYHKNRQGSFLTTKSVITRANDLDNYPERNRDKTSPDLQTCFHKQGHHHTCIYVNTRRPVDEKDPYGEQCGQNIMVTKVHTHPKWIYTAIQDYKHLPDHWRNMKFPWAVLELQDNIKLDGGQTVPPTLILPRTVLDMLYLIRRVDTMGLESKFCEYPHYNVTSKHGWNYYPPLARPEHSRVRKMDNFVYNGQLWRYNYYNTLCPSDTRGTGRSWEGVRVEYPPQDHHYRQMCNESLFFGIIPNFVLFHGNRAAFISKVDNDPVRLRTDDRLGAPVVCNGVAIGLISTWQERGVGLKDVYVTTTFLRGYRWIAQMAAQTQDKYYLRNPDDSPFLGERLPGGIKKHESYPTRNYHKDLFELSLNEESAVRPRSHGLAWKPPNTLLRVISFSIVWRAAN